jgi:hypothetical protein
LNIEQVLSEGDADFDVPDTYAGEGKNVLSNLFGLGEANTWKAAEFKATGSEGNINSYVSKVIKTLGLYKNKQETPTETPIPTPNKQNKNQSTPKPKSTPKKTASGFIPNFAAVNDAISREMEAGVPRDKIYVDQNRFIKIITQPRRNNGSKYH